MIFSIFSPSAGAVKPRRHSRILRADITAPERLIPLSELSGVISPEVTAKGVVSTSPR
jgi:hypothetical protein